MTTVTELPFNKYVGLQTSADPTKVLRLPANSHYLNHLGTVHASAQLALAEATSGEFLLRAVGSVEGLIPVVRRLEAKFRKPAHGEITSMVTTPPEEIDELKATLETKGQAMASVAVELYDESGANTLSSTVEWLIAKRV